MRDMGFEEIAERLEEGGYHVRGYRDVMYGINCLTVDRGSFSASVTGHPSDEITNEGPPWSVFAPPFEAAICTTAAEVVGAVQRAESLYRRAGWREHLAIFGILRVTAPDDRRHPHEWTQVLFIDAADTSTDDTGRLRLPEDRLQTADEFEGRFDEMISCGRHRAVTFEWLGIDDHVLHICVRAVPAEPEFRPVRRGDVAVTDLFLSWDLGDEAEIVPAHH